MNMDFHQASDAIRNLAKLFRHMEGAADALESIGSLEQAAIEKNRILSELDEKISGAKAAYDAATALTSKAQDDAQAILAQARQRAEDIVDEAHTSAKQVKDAAQAEAAKSLTTCRQDTSAMISKANLERERLIAERDALAREKFALTNEIKTAQEELKTITDRIAAARAQINKMLGQ